MSPDSGHKGCTKRPVEEQFEQEIGEKSHQRSEHCGRWSMVEARGEGRSQRRRKRNAGGRKESQRRIRETLVAGRKSQWRKRRNAGGRKERQGRKNFGHTATGIHYSYPHFAQCSEATMCSELARRLLKICEIILPKTEANVIAPGVRVTCQRHAAGQGDQGTMYTTYLFHY